jgi:hypothetical protein
MPVIAAHQPGGTSVKVMAHWYDYLRRAPPTRVSTCGHQLDRSVVRYRAQSIRNGTFSHFDYGAKENLEVYGQKVPPPYDLSSIHDARVLSPHHHLHTNLGVVVYAAY